MNNSLFSPTDDQNNSHLNAQQFISSQDGQQTQQTNALAGANSRGNHKRPKSNLDGFLKSSKNGSMNSNELP